MKTPIDVLLQTTIELNVALWRREDSEPSNSPYSLNGAFSRKSTVDGLV